MFTHKNAQAHAYTQGHIHTHTSTHAHARAHANTCDMFDTLITITVLVRFASLLPSLWLDLPLVPLLGR